MNRESVKSCTCVTRTTIYNTSQKFWIIGIFFMFISLYPGCNYLFKIQ